MMKQAALGDIVFSYQNNLAYDELTRVTDGGWVNIDRANQYPASQVVGRNLDKMTLSGKIIWPEGQSQLERLRKLQALQKPQSFIDGSGAVLGQYKIMQVTERQGNVIDDGNSLVTSFTIELEQYADD